MSKIDFVHAHHAIPVRLRRYVSEGHRTEWPGQPVLLLHGASANSGTFEVGPVQGGLAGWLANTGFDPWLLDWRGSGIVVDQSTNALQERGQAFNFNDAALEDLPWALRHIRAQVSREGYAGRIAIVGHCMGAGILAEAIATGALREFGIKRAVLLTLGLFYRTPIDGRIKSEERVLERLKASKSKSGEPVTKIDPRPSVETGSLDLETAWPDELEKVYKSWPARLKSHADEESDGVLELSRTHELCNRLAFMFGMPYHHPNLVEHVHGTAEARACLREQFGAMPLHMYIHAANNVRQGHATWYARQGNRDFLSDDARQEFYEFDKVTFITGELNRLWHRDSIDLMHEWVSRGRHDEKFPKHVEKGYGHQDLLWGQKAQVVYEKIVTGLRGDGENPDADREPPRTGAYTSERTSA